MTPDSIEADSQVGGEPLARLPSARPKVRSALLRGLLVAAGVLCVALGVLGAVLPLLPATPFLLLAAVCFARSSDRLHRWLFTNPWFGEYLRHFQAGDGMPLKAKVSTLVLLWLTLGASAWLGVPDRLFWVRPLLLLVGLGVTVYLLRLKTRPG